MKTFVNFAIVAVVVLASLSSAHPMADDSWTWSRFGRNQPVDDIEDLYEAESRPPIPVFAELSGTDGLWDSDLDEVFRPRRESPRFEGSIGVNRNQFGTDVDAEAKARLWQSQNGRTQVNGNANFDQHFGGPAGRQRPNIRGGVRFTHSFK